MKTNRNKVLLSMMILVFTLSVCSVGYIFAYYSNTTDVENVMQTGTNEVVLNEIFNEMDEWVPGETKQKEVSFENTGDIDQVIRFMITVEWLEESIDSEGTSTWETWGEGATDAVTLNFDDDFDENWTELDDGYYYLNTVLGASQSVEEVLESVTFSSELDNGGYGESLDYSNKKYSLTITMEALEASSDVTQTTWNATYTDDDGTLTWSLVTTPTNT